MDVKEFTKMAVEKFTFKLKNDTKKYILDVAKVGISDQLDNKQGFSVNMLERYIENISAFKTLFEKIDDIPIEAWANSVNFYFTVLSILLEKWEMTSKEKRSIIFNFIEKGIEKGILEDSDFVSSSDEAIHHYVINEVYLKKIKNGDMIDVYDLCDLRVALRNLLVSKNVIDEIINDIKLDSDIYSGLEEKDDSRLSFSMKKLRNSVFEYRRRFVLGELDDAMFEKILKYRELGVRNNLSFLEKVIFGECIFFDFKLLSDVLVLFKSEFKLNQADFSNIIFDIVDRNLKIGLLDGSSLVFPYIKLPEELLEEEKYVILLDEAFFEKISNYPGLEDRILEFSNSIKEQHTLLLSSYFNKKQSDGSLKDFSLRDLNNIKDALCKIEINDYVVGAIVKNLSHEVISSKSTILKNGEKEKLNSDEYKECMKKLKTYIQIDETLPSDEMINNSILILKFLTVKDKSICVDLMEKLGFSDKVILEFLIKAEKENLNLDIINVIVVYENEVKGWLDFYREYEEYRDRISEIEELYEEFYSCYINKRSEYKDWGSMLVEQINEFYLVIDSVPERNIALLKKIKGKKVKKIDHKE